jgi:phosphoserine phosphatase
VQIAPIDTVIARIDEARADSAGAGAIAFDGDGTLWTGDVGDDLWDAARAGRIFRAPAIERMRAEAAANGVRVDEDPDALVRAVHQAYLEHAFPEERMYELMTWCLAGWARADVRVFCQEVLRHRRHEGKLHAEALAVLRWAQTSGVHVLVVSASPRDIVEEAVAPALVGSAQVLASTPRYDASGVMLADVERPIPYGPGKVRRIRAKIGDLPLLAAFGDNAFDVAMLKEARVAVAVRPKDRLRERAGEVPGIVEIRSS